MKKLHHHTVIALCILIIASIVIVLSNADLLLAYSVIDPADNRWPGLSQPPWTVLYTVAPIPGLFLAGCSLVIFTAGFLFSPLKKFRRQSIFVILLLALGPGLLVNGILKEYLGRPRPNELVEFGGDYHFVPIGQPGPAGENSSFPSGHASIAFFVMAPWFIYRQRKPFRAYFFLWSGLAFGSAVGFARVMQGGHFLSDVLWAGGLIYITGEILTCFLLL